MDRTPCSNSKGRTVSPEEGQRILIQPMRAILEVENDIAAERTWRGYGKLLLAHGEKFLQDLGMLPLLKMQQTCAEMVIKMRLANKKGLGGEHQDELAEYERMLEESFTPVSEEPDGEEGAAAAAGDDRR